MRWIHVASVVTLLGGFIYARFVLAPALTSIAEPGRGELAKQTVERFRPLLLTVIVAILGSGLYNYLTKPSYPPHYHMWIGIKFLFVLHIFAVSLLYAMQDAGEAKRNRWLTGTVISGLIVVAVSAWLRWISLQ